MRVNGFGSRTQGLLFYFAFAGFWGFVLLGIQAIFVPKSGRSDEDFVVMFACAAIFLVLGLTYRLLARRMKRDLNEGRSGGASRHDLPPAR